MPKSTIPQGLSSAVVTSIPAQWSASWFRGFITNYLQSADIRNTTAGAGLSITPSTNGVAAPGTVALTTEYSNLLAEPYLLVGAPVAGSGLTAYRTIAGQSGVIAIGDGGAEASLTIGVAPNGIGAAQFRQSTAVSVVGNSTNAAANVVDISASADGQVLQRSGGTLSFAALPAGSLAAIANSTVLGNVSGGTASPVALNKTQLTTLVNVFSSTLSGAVPASGGVATTYLNGAGAFSTPPSSSGANPSATIGLTAVNGTASTFMTSDSAPPLSQGIAPTWTGVHTFTPAAGVSSTAQTINGRIALTGQGNGQIEITPYGAGAVLQAAFQYFQDNNLYVDAPTTGTPTGGSIIMRTGPTPFHSLTLNANQTASFSNAIGINGVTPPAQTTGFGTPTASSLTTNFPGTGATLVQCGGMISEMLLILKNYGFIGA